ncbi:replication protein a DNA-binding subunit [Grosmannia clavigera kw1407]|uniref:Replication protein A subunit n=1 Tax=Grosmannia clavigera (strain kw1407 / UAMH 11150) TaxID=655863 RepID=F0XFA7_GROCL|nr:replication protein a DNA-binding subunit [Grosmannia clavigera kw1407]EFX03800.1 replication protein a DNA-binding subunit [Grosmannia clavigera kw1407]
MAAAAERQITRGALAAIFSDPESARTQFPVPVLQCLQIKPLGPPPNGAAGAAGSERYRVVLSDVDNFVQTMLATQGNHVVHDGKLVRGSIVRIKAYQANAVKGKNILIILDLDVIESLGAHDKIGEPTPVDSSIQPVAAATSTNIGGTNFYGVKKEEPDTKQGIRGSIGAAGNNGNSTGKPSGTSYGGSNAAHPNIYPIEGLSPYSHKWTIKARVTSKSEIRTWHKSSGEGKLFSVNLLDESGEIKATGFNEQCDQYYDLLQEGSVYYISSPCRVNIAKKQFSNLPNDYELSFERDTQIEKAEDQSSVPQVRYAFCTLQALQSVEKDAVIDVIGVLRDVGEVSSITSKSSGKPYEKRELTLVDDSSFSVRTTIWGKTAVAFDAKPESVIAFKGVRVSDFGGRSLSLLQSGVMSIDPDITEAHHLKGWYDAAGRSENFSSHNSMGGMGGGAGSGRPEQVKTIAQVRDENIGMDETAYFTLKATIVFIKQETFAYPACSSDGCSKKVVSSSDGTWRCEKCDMNHPQALYRYTMMLNVNDHTGQLWLTCFDDVGRMIMGGRSADELTELREEDDIAFGAEFEKANCRKYSFRVRAKMDTFGDAQRIRYQIVNAHPLDFKSEGHKLAELIHQFSL